MGATLEVVSIVGVRLPAVPCTLNTHLVVHHEISQGGQDTARSINGIDSHSDDLM
jgi:hypothetical protein